MGKTPKWVEKELEFEKMLEGKSPKVAMNLRVKQQLHAWITHLENDFNDSLKMIREYIDMIEWERFEDG